MPVVNMTARFLETLRPGSVAVEWFDQGTRGLSLRINPGGAATWYYNYTRRVDAIRGRVQLGKLDAVPLRDARVRALKMAARVADGKDPAGDRRAEREALTVRDLVERFLVEYANAKRTGKRQRQMLVKDVLPVIGNAKAAAVSRRDIGRITDRMVGRGGNNRRLRWSRLRCEVHLARSLAITDGAQQLLGHPTLLRMNRGQHVRSAKWGCAEHSKSRTDVMPSGVLVRTDAGAS